MKKIPIWKNVVLIISLIVAIIVATFSWFLPGPRAEINNIEVNVGEAAYIIISPGTEGEWSEELDMEVGINDNFKEMSGNGSSFFVPVYDVVEKPTGGFAQSIVAFDKVKDNANYFEQLFVIRADADYDVYLGSESGVMTANKDESGYIEGAVRVAFFEIDENDNEILKYIWAPNSTIEYSQATDSFTTEGSVEPYYYYQKTVTPVDVDALTDDTENPHVVKISTADPENPDANLDCGYNETYKFVWSNSEELPEDAPALLSFTIPEGETTADKRMKIRIWVEGHDRECVSRLSKQKFTMKFQFNADKENDDE